jgi:hypothetical protein
LPLALAALAGVGVAMWTAFSVRYCPAEGDCAWSPWLGIPAAVISALALLAALDFYVWAVSGRGFSRAAWTVAATVALGVVWAIAFLIALASTA